MQDTGTEGEVAHTFRANWVYELPFGQGRRFGSDAGPSMNRLIGGWSFDGIARMQSGTTLDFGNVRLVGMSRPGVAEGSFKLRFDDAGKPVYILPQDIIDNTVQAFSTSATSATGYGAGGAPSGRYSRRPTVRTASRSRRATAAARPGRHRAAVVRFDLSAASDRHRRPTTNIEFRAEFLNAFNTPWFEAMATASNNPNNYRVTDADSGRRIQFVFRVNFWMIRGLRPSDPLLARSRGPSPRAARQAHSLPLVRAVRDGFYTAFRPKSRRGASSLRLFSCTGTDLQ